MSTHEGSAPPARVSSDTWFASGRRRPYDPVAAQLLAEPAAPGALHVWERVVSGQDPAATRWITMLPGFPDGSYGLAQIDALLGGTVQPRLYLEFLGHGDSDKPRGYAYSTAERADLVTAQWRAHGVTETFVMAFDYATLVVLELLARRLEGRSTLPRITGVLLANGGLFTDAHSHPWQTTPFMRSPFGRMMGLAQYSRALFDATVKGSRMYSAGSPPSHDELDDWFNVMSRHDGMFVLHADAGFVKAHRAEGDRLDFGRIYHAFRDRIDFTVTGATGDVLEGRQTTAARDRLGRHGLDVRFDPGGHLTTHEHPQLLAAAIRELADRTAPCPVPEAGERDDRRIGPSDD